MRPPDTRLRLLWSRRRRHARAAGQADILKGQGDILEGEAYGTAATLAQQNAQFTAQSTAIQVAQADRSLYMNIGAGKAAAAGAGGTGGGSAGDILRSSAEQGALNRGVLQQQGLITQAGYEEQATSYGIMQKAAGVAASAENVAAAGEQAAAGYEDTAKAIKQSQTGDFIRQPSKALPASLRWCWRYRQAGLHLQPARPWKGLLAAALPAGYRHHKPNESHIDDSSPEKIRTCSSGVCCTRNARLRRHDGWAAEHFKCLKPRPSCQAP